MAYSSSSDALNQLLMAREYGGTISRSGDHIITTEEGLEYYFVEVKFRDGSYYVIEARGEEAIHLHNEVRKLQEQMILVKE